MGSFCNNIQTINRLVFSHWDHLFRNMDKYPFYANTIDTLVSMVTTVTSKFTITFRRRKEIAFQNEIWSCWVHILKCITTWTVSEIFNKKVQTGVGIEVPPSSPDRVSTPVPFWQEGYPVPIPTGVVPHSVQWGGGGVLGLGQNGIAPLGPDGGTPLLGLDGVPPNRTGWWGYPPVGLNRGTILAYGQADISKLYLSSYFARGR